MVLESGLQCVTFSSDEFPAFNDLIKLLVILWSLGLYVFNSSFYLYVLEYCCCSKHPKIIEKDKKENMQSKAKWLYCLPKMYLISLVIFFQNDSDQCALPSVSFKHGHFHIMLLSFVFITHVQVVCLFLPCPNKKGKRKI